MKKNWGGIASKEEGKTHKNKGSHVHGEHGDFKSVNLRPKKVIDI